MADLDEKVMLTASRYGGMPRSSAVPGEGAKAASQRRQRALELAVELVVGTASEVAAETDFGAVAVKLVAAFDRFLAGQEQP